MARLGQLVGPLDSRMKLARLAEEIVKAAPNNALSLQELYASLDFRGLHNARLAIPDWHTSEFRAPDMERHEFLTGEEDIGGDVLVFNYSAHDRAMILYECDTLEEAAGLVVGDAGVFNAFTDFVLVFEHFRLRPYRVSYRAKGGERVFFCRDRWNHDDRPFPDRQIEWLDVAAQSGRRGDCSPRRPHHRTCGSASGGSWQS